MTERPQSVDTGRGRTSLLFVSSWMTLGRTPKVFYQISVLFWAILLTFFRCSGDCQAPDHEANTVVHRQAVRVIRDSGATTIVLTAAG
jgi:hypothetical protein